MALLPKSPDKLPDIKKQGGSLALSSPTSHRSLKWLKAHGRCMDHIRPGPSTVPHAGGGAFANRDIVSGSLVAPVPLIQITDEAIMDMYKLKEQTDEEDGTYLI
jgi:hypothetical protein